MRPGKYLKSLFTMMTHERQATVSVQFSTSIQGAFDADNQLNVSSTIPQLFFQPLLMVRSCAITAFTVVFGIDTWPSFNLLLIEPPGLPKQHIRPFHPPLSFIVISLTASYPFDQTLLRS